MRKLYVSLLFAIDGLKYAFKNERNFKIELFAAISVVTASYLLKITKTEWLIVIINIAAVMVAEIFNTAIENTCNIISPQKSATVKIIKDTAAAAVLLSVIGACVCGLIIFLPYFIKLINL